MASVINPHPLQSIHSLPAAFSNAAHAHNHSHNHPHAHGHPHSHPHGHIPAEDHSDNESSDDGEEPSTLPDLDVPVPKEGDVFNSFEALRYAINAWALRDKFLSRCHKKDTSRAIYVCRYHAKGCQWRVRANVSRDNPEHIVVTVVQPGHSCTPHLTLDSEGKARYAKRGVQYTQRFVRDAITRVGLQLTPETDPTEIVRVITERFGETIPDRLAQKVKQSILVANGQVLAKKPKGPGRPSRDDMQQRQREAEAQMAEMRERSRQQSLQQLSMSSEPIQHRAIGEGLPNSMDPGINYGQAPPMESLEPEERPFVFESGFRVIGPVGAHQPPRRNALTRQSITSSTPNPPFTNSTTSSPAIAPSRPTSVPCTACSGTGVVNMSQQQQQQTQQQQSQQSQQQQQQSQQPQHRQNSSIYQTPSLYGASPNMSSAPISSLAANTNNGGNITSDDEMLNLMHQQVGLMMKQIELMQKKRAGVSG